MDEDPITAPQPIYLANAVTPCNCTPEALCETFQINTLCFWINSNFITIN